MGDSARVWRASGPGVATTLTGGTGAGLTSLPARQEVGSPRGLGVAAHADANLLPEEAFAASNDIPSNEPTATRRETL